LFDQILKIFGKGKAEIKDFSSVVVDIHSHLIPGIDDGAPTMEASIGLIKDLSQLGYQKIITTPHVMAGVYDNTNEIVLNGLEEVRNEIKKQSIPIDLEAGAEYYLDEIFEQRVDDQLPLLTIGDKYVLFETGFGYEPNNLKNIIFKLNSEGYKPILAHPERYQYLHGKNIAKYIELKEMGVYYQLNITSLTGVYTKNVKSVSEKLIDEGLIDFVGTDLHNKKHLEFLISSMNEIYLEKLIESGKLLNKQLL